MPRKRSTGRQKRGDGLNKRLAYNLARGHDWPVLDPVRGRRTAAYEPTEDELRAAWREYGSLLLAWTRGEVGIPEISHGPHLCMFTERPYPNCTAYCPKEKRPLWALEQFGPPEAA